ncbi:MAG: MarR family transcriptional regulator [Thermoproteota archaeon]|nr:MarR family transcriptional regulator [Thermoproteota archaeon]
MNINESPSHFIVLDAVSRGNNTIEKICRSSRLDKYQVEQIVNDLVQQRLVTSAEKRGSFLSSLLGGRRTKVVLSITSTGLRLLNVKKQELEQKAAELHQWYNNGDRSQMQGFMDSNRMWIPMMLFSGIMNVLFFTSMMSFMGMALNPTESQMAADSSAGGGETTEGGTETSAEADSASSSSTDAGSGGDVADTSDMGGMGDFGGFDGGGFGDF